MIFKILNKKPENNFDYKDILVTMQPSIPSDDLLAANIISQAGNALSLETKVSLFSFVTNPIKEAEAVRKEQEQININNQDLIK